MPNWTSNGLTLKHADPAMIDRAQHCKGLLMEFLPTPAPLIETVSGWFGDTDRQAELEAQRARNVAQYGSPDWYDWNVKHWGTKWDFEFDSVERVDDNTLTARFDSAWSPPIEAYEKLEELGFEIDAKYYEPGMCFVGTYVTGLGECTFNYTAGAQDVRDEVGEELDDFFGISESMAEYDEEEDS